MKTLSAKSVLFIVYSLYACAVNAQVAVLPANWGFDTNTPEGWTESLGASNTRYANGNTGMACRLDMTGDFVVLQFA